MMAGGYYALQNDVGLERSLYFYLRAFPPYVHYRIVQFQIRNEDEDTQSKEFARLHNMYRERPLEVNKISYNQQGWQQAIKSHLCIINHSCTKTYSLSLSIRNALLVQTMEQKSQLQCN
jgi:hypothetical protein